MDNPLIYEVRVEGHLAGEWSDWFDGMAICKQPDGSTALMGSVLDQSALFGLLGKIRDLNLTLLSVNRLPSDPL